MPARFRKKMKFTTYFKTRNAKKRLRELTYQGDIRTTYRAIVDAFGIPKENVEWDILFRDGTIATIYSSEFSDLKILDYQLEWLTGISWATILVMQCLESWNNLPSIILKIDKYLNISEKLEQIWTYRNNLFNTNLKKKNKFFRAN